MISAIELKRCIANVGIFSIVVSELRYENKLCSIILLKVDKSLKVGFYYIILPLSLVVHLQVEDGNESLLDIEEIA